ncbi:MAG: four helix bundle protein [Terracidiphilus sp.]|jgi:four helix bundle protein
MLQRFDDSDLFNRAMEMSIWVHALAETFPPSEDVGLKSRLCSICDSMAGELTDGIENSGRMNIGAFLKVLGKAELSNREIQNELSVVRQLRVGDEQARNNAEALCTDISFKLNELIQSASAVS